MIDDFYKELKMQYLEELITDTNMLYEFIKYYEEEGFGELSPIYGKTIELLKLKINNTRQEYERKYGEQINYKDAIRILSRHRSDVVEKGRTPRNTITNITTVK